MAEARLASNTYFSSILIRVASSASQHLLTWMRRYHMTRRERFYRRISHWRIRAASRVLEPELMTRIILDQLLGRPLRLTARDAREFLAKFRAWRAKLPPGTSVEIPAELP